MTLLNEEHKISTSFLQKPWKKLTYSEIQKISGKKSKSYIYRALNHLTNEKIIQTERVGKSILYELTISGLQTQSYLGNLSEYLAWQSSHIPQDIINKLAEKIGKITSFFILIVTGSYANKTQTKKSDLDIAIICDDKVNPQSIMAEIKLESNLSIPQVHPYIFTRKQFTEMLTNKEFNYGKEIAKNNIIFFGGSIYFNILNEAIEHGFKG
ncbi:MAG: nucleotidyltransferase domain-containing protein [Nanoarchaeota archaeon]